VVARGAVVFFSKADYTHGPSCQVWEDVATMLTGSAIVGNRCGIA
jgi:hypothetical protein